MTETTFRASIAAMLFCSVSIVAGAWSLKAMATINSYQEQQAEAICKIEPTLCGQSQPHQNNGNVSHR